jgi:hypothetical protein
VCCQSPNLKMGTGRSFAFNIDTPNVNDQLDTFTLAVLAKVE